MKKIFLMLLVLIMMLSTVVCAGNFSDTVGKNCEYAIDRIEYLGIVNGTGENKFNPEKTVTRAELSKMVTEIVAKNAGSSTKTFADIEGHWGKSYISKAIGLGILNGYSDGTFKPNNSVSYAEAIAIIMRCMGYSDLEKNTSSVWYENYITKMKEIGLDFGLEDFNPNAGANRGDISIILWNMLISKYRVNNDVIMLEEYYPDFKYFEDEKITALDVYNGKILYVTSRGNFYKEKDINFSDLGGYISGIYDSKNHVMNGMIIDGGIKYKKISGSFKSMTEAGYDVLTCNNISGYGDKDHAEYVELFVDEKTDKTVRVVFYDTRESHFAESIKVGSSLVTVESRDVFDESIVLLKNGKTITYNILRTESVKDIPTSAILVNEGSIVEWKELPDNSVIREIVKNKIYTYIHRYVDGKIENGKANYKTLIMNNKEYDVSEDCICQSVETKQTMKLTEGLTRANIKTLSEKDNKVRIYLNEFDEIVKLEFNYDVWEVEDLEDREKEYKDYKYHLERIGYVTNVNIHMQIESESRISVLSLSNDKKNTYDDANNEFKKGDFVYLPSGETKVKKVTDKLEIGSMKVVLGYIYPIRDNKMGEYNLVSDTQIYEVLLTKDQKDNSIYSKCNLVEKKVDELRECTRYKTINLIVNEDDQIIRIYAVREVGHTLTLGVVKEINKELSGDVLIKTVVTIENSDKKKVKYTVDPVMGYEQNDIVTYRVIENKDKEKLLSKNKEAYDHLVVDEVYRHGNIGSKYDLVVDRCGSEKAYIENSNVIIDLNAEYFEYNGKKYYYDEYTLVYARVTKNSENGEWIFGRITVTNSVDHFHLKSNDRIAIDEITGTIVAYTGYTD